MIPVTKPFLPPIEEYEVQIHKIWESEWLTNNGPVVLEFEEKIKSYLALDNFYFVTNGTIALQLAIKALNLQGEIITTPFSYVATTSSIVWENCIPVFADIDGETLNVCPKKIEQAITPKTSAILVTHCFGNPCDVYGIESIAKKYDLKVIYDAAHCFGTGLDGKSILSYGDVSVLSFHATKIMHSTEGGGVVCKDSDVLERIKFMRNFGHNGPYKFNGIGINGKNSELHAAMGLCVLNHFDRILKTRQLQHKIYDELLNTAPLNKPKIAANTSYNYSYYPVIFTSQESCNCVMRTLEQNEIFPRRYFFPSLSELDYVSSAPMPVSDQISKTILCLPLFDSLTRADQERIAEIILNSI